MVKVIINCDIFDYESYRKNQYIRFDEEIIKVGPMEDFKKNGNENIIDFKGKLVMPGFVNGHTHIYSTFARGMSVDFNPKSFSDILKQLWWKMDSKIDLETTYYSALVSGIEFLKNGITAVIDHHASGMAIKGTLNELKKGLSDEIGIRGIFCFETSDRFDVDECIQENVEFLKSSSEKYVGMFGLHASLSLSNETLKKVSDTLEGAPIHIHVAESIEDEEDSLNKYEKRVVERLEKFNLLNKNSILSHCVHINEKEADIMSKYDIYVALNPTSNMNNAVGLPNYKLLKEKGINTIVGNDGLGYNITREYLNLYFTQKYRYGDPTFFNFEDLKNNIDNVYKLVGEMLGIKLGRIKEGYKADMISYDYIPFTPLNKDNIFGHVFFGIWDKLDVIDTIIDGEFLMKDREIKFKVEKIYSEARKVSEKLWTRL
ncbi:putative selenium metabolism protein SsnA [Marinitoga hydrogenitolerans DSM 16785]|uniref:Selenium metabolism protein SsnA n=1 Tax=Marinitoga hydrogenitolerans (strain DSM 16785 / JCM 12826 / AT1271) TaxID=1122195 RepID=A0A1M4ZVN8_MARH1|nr:amidohydrolase family protein [Marinitoga hydrogenitolerans]SHF21877.1 putative selenium metabolism protein SsnA [Marinitoga hydrogenitolerans DSM 16785]